MFGGANARCDGTVKIDDSLSLSGGAIFEMRNSGSIDRFDRNRFLNQSASINSGTFKINNVSSVVNISSSFFLSGGSSIVNGTGKIILLSQSTSQVYFPKE